eukprot:sb/3469099/
MGSSNPDKSPVLDNPNKTMPFSHSLTHTHTHKLTITQHHIWASRLLLTLSFSYSDSLLLSLTRNIVLLSLNKGAPLKCCIMMLLQEEINSWIVGHLAILKWGEKREKHSYHSHKSHNTIWASHDTIYGHHVTHTQTNDSRLGTIYKKCIGCQTTYISHLNPSFSLFLSLLVFSLTHSLSLSLFLSQQRISLRVPLVRQNQLFQVRQQQITRHIVCITVSSTVCNTVPSTVCSWRGPHGR